MPSPWVWPFIILQSLVLAYVGYKLVRWREKKERERWQALNQNVYRARPPEFTREIIPLRPLRGACGVEGCPILKPHSHVADLARRLKEEKRK